MERMDVQRWLLPVDENNLRCQVAGYRNLKDYLITNGLKLNRWKETGLIRELITLKGAKMTFGKHVQYSKVGTPTTKFPTVYPQIKKDMLVSSVPIIKSRTMQQETMQRRLSAYSNLRQVKSFIEKQCRPQSARPSSPRENPKPFVLHRAKTIFISPMAAGAFTRKNNNEILSKGDKLNNQQNQVSTENDTKIIFVPSSQHKYKSNQKANKRIVTSSESFYQTSKYTNNEKQSNKTVKEIDAALECKCNKDIHSATQVHNGSLFIEKSDDVIYKLNIKENNSDKSEYEENVSENEKYCKKNNLKQTTVNTKENQKIFSQDKNLCEDKEESKSIDNKIIIEENKIIADLVSTDNQNLSEKNNITLECKQDFISPPTDKIISQKKKIQDEEINNKVCKILFPLQKEDTGITHKVSLEDIGIKCSIQQETAKQDLECNQSEEDSNQIKQNMEMRDSNSSNDYIKTSGIKVENKETGEKLFESQKSVGENGLKFIDEDDSCMFTRDKLETTDQLSNCEVPQTDYIADNISVNQLMPSLTNQADSQQEKENKNVYPLERTNKLLTDQKRAGNNLNGNGDTHFSKEQDNVKIIGSLKDQTVFFEQNIESKYSIQENAETNVSLLLEQKIGVKRTTENLHQSSFHEEKGSFSTTECVTSQQDKNVLVDFHIFSTKQNLQNENEVLNCPCQNRVKENSCPSQNLVQEDSSLLQNTVHENSCSPDNLVQEDSTAFQNLIQESSCSPQNHVQEYSCPLQNFVQELSCLPQNPVHDNSCPSLKLVEEYSCPQKLVQEIETPLQNNAEYSSLPKNLLQKNSCPSQDFVQFPQNIVSEDSSPSQNLVQKDLCLQDLVQEDACPQNFVHEDSCPLQNLVQDDSHPLQILKKNSCPLVDLVQSLKENSCPLQNLVQNLKENSCPLQNIVQNLKENSCSSQNLVQQDSHPLQSLLQNIKEKSCPLQSLLQNLKENSCPSQNLVQKDSHPLQNLKENSCPLQNLSHEDSHPLQNLKENSCPLQNLGHEDSHPLQNLKENACSLQNLKENSCPLQNLGQEELCPIKNKTLLPEFKETNNRFVRCGEIDKLSDKSTHSQRNEKQKIRLKRNDSQLLESKIIPQKHDAMDKKSSLQYLFTGKQNTSCEEITEVSKQIKIQEESNRTPLTVYLEGEEIKIIEIFTSNYAKHNQTKMKNGFKQQQPRSVRRNVQTNEEFVASKTPKQDSSASKSSAHSQTAPRASSSSNSVKSTNSSAYVTGSETSFSLD